jgi:hypothetical protein
MVEVSPAYTCRGRRQADGKRWSCPLTASVAIIDQGALHPIGQELIEAGVAPEGGRKSANEDTGVPGACATIRVPETLPGPNSPLVPAPGRR